MMEITAGQLAAGALFKFTRRANRKNESAIEAK
jgi:hypothetical protein